jgi:hypothetical protein
MFRATDARLAGSSITNPTSCENRKEPHQFTIRARSAEFGSVFVAFYLPYLAKD